MIEHVADLAHARGGDRLSKDVRMLFRSLLPVHGNGSNATASEALDRVREIARRDLNEDACAAAFVQFVRYEATATVIATFDAAKTDARDHRERFAERTHRRPDCGAGIN